MSTPMSQFVERVGLVLGGYRNDDERSKVRLLFSQGRTVGYAVAAILNLRKQQDKA